MESGSHDMKPINHLEQSGLQIHISVMWLVLEVL
jgi:hypothetical protein